MNLSATEKRILESYESVLDSLAEYMGTGYEFVLHNLENLDHSAIKVINGHYSGRKEGAPITDLALSLLSKINENKSNLPMTYFNKSINGSPIRSTTIPIFGDKQRVIGLICINFYMDTPLSAILKSFIPASDSKNFTLETFVTNTDEIIDSSLEYAKLKVFNDISISSVNKNKEIITLLFEEGIFSFKDTVTKVATNLGISKNTVYMHIRKLNNQDD